MKPAQRLRLMKEIASRFEKMEWPEIDTTLRLFELPWTDQWSGGKYEYVLHCLECAEPEPLAELYEYLCGSDTDEAEENEAKSIWGDDAFRLFVSHVSAKKESVTSVKTALRKFGVDSFVAHQDIEPTKEWVTVIEDALSTCDALAAFLTDGFKESNWTDQEVGFCVGRRILIIPVRADLDPYGFISRYQGIQGKGKDAGTIAEEIFEVLIKHPLSSAKMTRALVRKFSESTSFSDAKHNMGLLERCKGWTPELLRAIEEATQKNGQIKDAWGVPERVRALIEAHST